ncbi:MAG TPA: HAMP domain-containing protein, partial [Ideonella sp.]|nr:HAMP domain-containing protein [Ideonella sp.]
MSLRLKINLVMAVLTLAFAAAVIALQFRSMRESVGEETLAANHVASQLLNRAAWGYAAQGTPAMLAFLQGVGRVRSNDIWLFDAAGRELYRSPPSPYKAGRDAPDWFDRLVSPPPSEQSIQFPDGKLVVRANASRAVLDAWDYLVVLALASLGLLVAVNALVFWIVGRTVRPFGRIVAALDEVQAGRFDVALPALPGREAGAIGAAFNRMAGVLRQNLENERRAILAERQLSDSRELRQWIDQQIERERQMIARELHDELGQSVTAIRSMALSVAQRTQPRDPESAQAARLIADESSRLYDAMHGLIPRLAPLVLDRFGLAEALADLAERTRRSQGAALQLALQVELGEAALSNDAAIALYRAAQEGLTNALRHGGAGRIEVRVQARPDGTVALWVDDDGRGLAGDAAPAHGQGHHGLRWLAERVHGLGGEFGIEARAPRGVRLAVVVPGGA